ncbi:MAG TPA: hypothetical protein DGG94_16760 [Micromonosporaceae bacterium]|nr:hypothetical protein [Micromonosporaceae bacterium]HCU51423.1 hypothetical protein [Micromonosporaceae bacterium]
MRTVVKNVDVAELAQLRQIAVRRTSKSEYSRSVAPRILEDKRASRNSILDAGRSRVQPYTDLIQRASQFRHDQAPSAGCVLSIPVTPALCSAVYERLSVGVNASRVPGSVRYEQFRAAG